MRCNNGNIENAAMMQKWKTFISHGLPLEKNPDLKIKCVVPNLYKITSSIAILRKTHIILQYIYIQS